MTPKQLRRLQSLDATLASLEGLHRATFAREQGISQHTVLREMETLRDMGAVIICKKQGKTHTPNCQYRWWYRDRRRRVFRTKG